MIVHRNNRITIVKLKKTKRSRRLSNGQCMQDGDRRNFRLAFFVKMLLNKLFANPYARSILSNDTQKTTKSCKLSQLY